MAVTLRRYRQIADSLQERIEVGAYSAGAQLPAEAVLAGEFGAARDTMRLALALLVDRGFVVTIHGRGSFVRDDGRAGYGQPKYAQVVSAIREDVRLGRLVAGEWMPSEAELCKRFSMSRITVRRALAELEKAGVLVSGKGGRRVVA